MSTRNVVAKFVNLHDYQEHSEGKHKSRHSVAKADNNGLVPNNSTNSTDHTAKRDSPIHPDTSGEVYNRRQVLRSIYSAKRTVPATSRKHCFAASSQLDQGRTPQGELIDNLREELYSIKRNCAATLKENVVLKTRLKRLSNEIVKKDRQLQNLLLSESKGYVSDDRRKNVLLMKQKIVMLESVLEEKTNEISRLKYGRAATSISEYQEQRIAGLQKQCKHCHTYVIPPSSKIRADVRNLPKGQRTASESNNARTLKEVVSLLEEENDLLRSKLRIFFNCSNCSPHELSTFEREELIALIIHLKSELRKKESRKDSNTKSGQPRQDDTLLACGQKLLPVRQKFGKPINRFKTNKKVAALDNGSQEDLRAEIVKIHSDDEEQRTTASIVKMTEPPKVATQIEGSGTNADTDNYTSSRKGGKYEDSKDRADEHPTVYVSCERPTSEDKCNEMSSEAANEQFIKRNSNYSSELEGGEDEERPSSDVQQQPEKTAPAKRIEADETRQVARLELKKDEVVPSFVFRSILRITSAHLKRLELLAAKTNSYSLHDASYCE
ncbi:unnamed protein product [Litomosoides sigmodontis]|uniref:Uncharacterized protein n=1 Tax=Litomosoides sigmodontis TaxID=42156 RepID=A0A3P6T9U1_LITSI|nr:unnamed protein product [Litomosoides sigmodontis]